MTIPTGNKSSTTKYNALLADTPVVEAIAVPTTKVELVAPTDLVGGYLLHVDLNGRPVTVQVPSGGVKQGERFIGAVVSQSVRDQHGHSIPTGHWRDGTCDCCAHGCCHPLLCLTCWCSPLALAQVMTRMKLDACGHETKRGVYWSAFKVLFVVFVLYVALDETFSILVNPYVQVVVDEDGNIVENDTPIPTWVYVILGIRALVRFIFFVYMLVLTIKTRAQIRNRYNIPENSCKGCEDCCCAFWVPCCTVTQMARHTADYHTYSAACCTENGLPQTAPEVV